MKSLLTLMFLCLALVGARAQEDEELPSADPKVREKIHALRIAYITDQLGLTPEEAERFWPIYREFSEKRQALLQQYRASKKNPDPDKTAEQNDQELVDMRLKLKQQEVDLEKDYSGRLLKVISAQKLKTLPETERKFRQMILDQIQRRQLQQQRRENMRDRSQERLRQRNN
ncbi:MAG TPA: hypothetical protein VD816_18735 [Ohtaekwangia sp.]|nr:hypothetical protein [Ohtaekwangia sp.]